MARSKPKNVTKPPDGADKSKLSDDVYGSNAALKPPDDSIEPKPPTKPPDDPRVLKIQATDDFPTTTHPTSFTSREASNEKTTYSGRPGRCTGSRL